MSQHSNVCHNKVEELKAKIFVATTENYVATKDKEKKNRKLSRNSVSKRVFYVTTFQNYVTT